MSAQGWNNLGYQEHETVPTLKALASSQQAFANAFSVATKNDWEPTVVASSNRGLELANAFGV